MSVVQYMIKKIGSRPCSGTIVQQILQLQHHAFHTCTEATHLVSPRVWSTYIMANHPKPPQSTIYDPNTDQMLRIPKPKCARGPHNPSTRRVVRPQERKPRLDFFQNLPCFYTIYTDFWVCGVHTITPCREIANPSDLVRETA